MMIFVIVILAVFFAVNMGGASFAASFAAAYGGRIIPRFKAGILFTLFVILGSVMLGKNVCVTLSTELVQPSIFDQKALMVIFLMAGLSMFWANRMHIPQSTSLVTVAAIAGVGTFKGALNLSVLFRLIPFWIILPIISYGLTHFIASQIYPPRASNFWFYEKFINHQDKLRRFVLMASCYNAFSVGTNNVANIAGPITGTGSMTLISALAIFALIYGAGAFIFTGPLKTSGEQIVPLGLTTAAIISLVSGTLMIMASLFGIPQSFVMLQLGAIFAISSVKHTHAMTFEQPITRKTLYTWTINPFVTFALTYGLMWILNRF